MAAITEELHYKRDDHTRRTLAAALAISLIVHLAALISRAPVMRPSSERSDLHGPTTLSVLIAPRAASRPPSPPPAPAVRRAPPRAKAHRLLPRPKAAPPVLALNRPAPDAVPRVPAPAPPAAPAAPAAGDLSSYIAAQRRARTAENTAPAPAFPPAAPAPPAPVEDENARANRLAAANLGTGRAPTFGERVVGGGIFSVRYVAYDYAEFMFYGWNEDIRRNTAQLIEVRKGDAPDIRVAIVRRMIAIIRDHEQGDFLWESQRLGRVVRLSARARDNAGLEEFMLHEFF